MRKDLMSSKTCVIILREMAQDDYPALAAILQDEQTMYAYEGAFDDTETQNWLDRQIERYQTDGFGLWAVVLKSSGDMIGQTGISWQDVDGERVPEIGYLFNRSYWHNGYATEAAIACKEYAFNTLGFKEIYSIVRSTNIASKNVAIRNGMIIRNRIVRHFRGIDMPHFVLSATNPPRLLRMDEFFSTQAPAYDEYMLNNVAGYSKGCAELAKHIPDYDTKKAVLFASGIALCDVIAECEPDGALDSGICNPVYRTKLPEFIAGMRISKVFFNGNNAYQFYRRGIGEIERCVLPSSSPANARMRFDEKLGRWRENLRDENVFSPNSENCLSHS